jgi:hypothetical protein
VLIAVCNRRRLSHALFAVSPVLSLSFLDAAGFPLSAAALHSLKAEQRAAECPLGDVWDVCVSIYWDTCSSTCRLRRGLGQSPEHSSHDTFTQKGDACYQHQQIPTYMSVLFTADRPTLSDLHTPLDF